MHATTTPPLPLSRSAVPAASTDQPFDADSTLTYLDSPTRRVVNKTVAALGLAVYAGYLIYRTLFTINPDALVFSLLVYGAEVLGFFSLCFYFFQTWELRGRNVPAPPEDVSVDVFITTYNEEIDIVRQTARAAVAMAYPHTTCILDDGRRAEVKAMAEELGCRYITRATNEHAKAGNWNNAFRRTSGSLIATFDADHAPRADFLLRTLGFFRDPKVALVQVPQRYHNVDSLQHRVSWKQRRMYGEQDMFFNIVCPGKDHWNAAFFCGTGAVLRREALEKRGGLETGSITEDMHTSLALHAEGWKSVYLDELLVTGLAPMDFASFQVQRLRWAEGNLKIIRAINPITCPGLTLPQRICYAASMYHWTIGVPKMIFYVAPPWILFTSTYPIANFLPQFVYVYLLFLVSLAISYKVLSRGTGRLMMDEVYNMATAFTLNRAVKRLLFGRGRRSIFVVTDKKGGNTTGHEHVLPYFVLAAFSVLALEWSALSLWFGAADDRFGIGVTAVWALCNLAMMAVVVEMALRPAQKRDACRFAAALPVTMPSPPITDPREVGMTANVSPTGCELLWRRPLPAGSVWSMSIALGGQALECRGEVSAVFRRRQGAWFVHGIRFVGLSQRQTDFLNDALFNMVVPRLFDHLSQPPLFTRVRRSVMKRVRAVYSARQTRRLVSVPVQLVSAHVNVLTLTHDISATGFGVVSPRQIPVGAPVTVTVLGGEPSSINASVARCQPLPSSLPAFRTWLVGLEVDSAADTAVVHKRVSEEAAA